MPIDYMVDFQSTNSVNTYVSKAEVPNTGINGYPQYSAGILNVLMENGNSYRFHAHLRTAGSVKVECGTFVKNGQLKSRFVLSEGVFAGNLPSDPFTHNALLFRSVMGATKRVFGFTINYENISGNPEYDDVYGILSLVQRTGTPLGHVTPAPKFQPGVDYSVRVVQTPKSSTFYSDFELYINGVLVGTYLTNNTDATSYYGIAAGARRSPASASVADGSKLFDLVNCKLTITDVYMNIVKADDVDQTIVHGHIDVNHVSPESYSGAVDWKVVDGTSLQSVQTDTEPLQALALNNSALADADKRLLTPGRSSSSIDLNYNYRSSDLIAAQVAVHHTPPAAGLGRLKIESLNSSGEVIDTTLTPASSTGNVKYLNTQTNISYPVQGQTPEEYAISTVRISRE